MSADKKANDKDAKRAGFEADLERLEKLVASLEEGEVPLDELVSKYEQGMRLLRSCQEGLKAAELRISELGRREESQE
ncbi:MAG: exodeoxyribonuclease VII small subunit [Opitutales bacterium]|jgi:exodeoxyribonuclease VII small subunit